MHTKSALFFLCFFLFVSSSRSLLCPGTGESHVSCCDQSLYASYAGWDDQFDSACEVCDAQNSCSNLVAQNLGCAQAAEAIFICTDEGICCDTLSDPSCCSSGICSVSQMCVDGQCLKPPNPRFQQPGSTITQHIHADQSNWGVLGWYACASGYRYVFSFTAEPGMNAAAFPTQASTQGIGLGVQQSLLTVFTYSLAIGVNDVTVDTQTVVFSGNPNAVFDNNGKFLSYVDQESINSGPVTFTGLGSVTATMTFNAPCGTTLPSFSFTLLVYDTSNNLILTTTSPSYSYDTQAQLPASLSFVGQPFLPMC